MPPRKSYKRLQKEHEGILEETLYYKQGLLENRRMGLWNNSTYLDELYYIRLQVEKDMIPHQIVHQMKIYQQFNIPIELILHISSFGGMVEQSAACFLEQDIDATIEAVDPI